MIPASPHIAGLGREGFRHDINALRAIAVVGVLLFHFSIWPFGGGYAGVDVFFVISGFLMTDIVARRQTAGSFGVVAFWRDRARRIVPALGALLLVMLVLGLICLDPLRYAEMARSAVAPLLFYSNVEYWFAGGYFDTPQHSKWFLHTWSLSVEWQFYIVYPLAMLMLTRLVKSEALRIGVYLAALLLSLAVCVWAAAEGAGIHPKIATGNFYLLPTRAWEMMLGGLVALAPAWLSALRRSWLHWMGLALIGVSFVSFDARTPWPSIWTLVPALGTAAVLLAADQGRWARSASLARLGLWSYSIYLWHWPLKVGLDYFDVVDSLWVAAIAIAASIALGALSYIWIETPSRRWLTAPGLGRWAGGAAGLVALMLTATAVVSADGLPGRRGGDARYYADLRAAAADWDFACPSKRFFDAVPPDCIRGGSGGTKVALVGDSHMQQWYGRFGQTGADRPEIHFLTASGCPPIPDTSRQGLGLTCFNNVNSIWDSLDKEDFDVVVIEASWRFYSEVDGGRLCFIWQGACVSESAEAYPAAFRAALEKLSARLATLKARGARVILVLDMPGAGLAHPEELAFRRFHGRPLDDISYTNAFPPTEAVAQAGRRAGVEVVNPVDHVCTDGRCPALTADGHLLYRDTGHLRSSAMRTGTYDFLDPYILGRDFSDTGATSGK